MDLQPTIAFAWLAGGSNLNLQSEDVANSWSASGVFTDAIATAGADQIGLLVAAINLSQSETMNALVRVQWGTQTAVDIDVPTTNAWYFDSVEAYVGLTVAGTPQGQRYRMWPKEYSFVVPINGSAQATLWIPTAAHYFRIGCMTEQGPETNSSVAVLVERGKTGSPLQQGR
jgi:hypothetical protein